MGLFRRTAQAATGISAMEAIATRMLAEAHAASSEEVLLIATQGDLGARNSPADALPFLIGRLQAAGHQVVRTEGADGFSNSVRIWLRVHRQAQPFSGGTAGAATCICPAQVEGRFNEYVETAPVELETDARIECYERGLVVRSPSGVFLEASWDSLRAAVLATESHFTAGGFTLYEFARSTTPDRQLAHRLLVSTRGMGVEASREAFSGSST